MPRRKEIPDEPKPPAETRTTLDAGAIASRVMLSVGQAAILSNLSQSYLRLLWDRGEGPPFILKGKRRLVRRAALEKWAAEQEAATMKAVKAKAKEHAAFR